MSVDVWMSHPVHTCQPGEALHDAMERMLAAELRHLVVVDEAGTLAGVLLDDEAGPRLAGPARVADASVPVDVELAVDADPVWAVRALRASKVGVAVVVDGRRRPVGILTEHDGVRIAIERMSPGLLVDSEARFPCVQIGRDAPAADALATMVTEGIRHLVVTDAAGHAIGVVSRRDLRLAGDLTGQLVADVLVGTPLIAVQLGDGMQKAAARMVDEHIGCVPVVDPRRKVAVGMITRRDAIDVAINALQDDDLFPTVKIPDRR